MKYTAFAVALSASVAFATAARAADVTIEPSTTYDWSGVYIGLQAGGVWGESDDTVTSVKVNGGTFGGYVGVNWQNGNLVYGVEGEIAYNSADGKFMGLETGFDWHGALRARLGYAFDNVLVYGAGGLAFARAYLDAMPFAEADETFTGWTIGGGAEYGFAQNWIARLDYRYSDYGSSDFGFSDLGFGEFDPTKMTEHTVRVGVAYKF